MEGGRDKAEEEMRQFSERTSKEEGGRGGKVKEFLRGRDYEGYLWKDQEDEGKVLIFGKMRLRGGRLDFSYMYVWEEEYFEW